MKWPAVTVDVGWLARAAGLGVVLAFAATACGGSTKPRHSFQSASERSRGEAVAIREAVRSEDQLDRFANRREPSPPTHCTESVVVAPTKLSCVVRFETVDGSDSYTITVALNPPTGALSVKRNVANLETTFSP
jgi:hypothetical protein